MRPVRVKSLVKKRKEEVRNDASATKVAFQHLFKIPREGEAGPSNA